MPEAIVNINESRVFNGEIREDKTVDVGNEDKGNKSKCQTEFSAVNNKDMDETSNNKVIVSDDENLISGQQIEQKDLSESGTSSSILSVEESEKEIDLNDKDSFTITEVKTEGNTIDIDFQNDETSSENVKKSIKTEVTDEICEIDCGLISEEIPSNYGDCDKVSALSTQFKNFNKDNNENADDIKNRLKIRSSRTVQDLLLKIKPEVDPVEIECVVTDTSDVDTDDELLIQDVHEFLESINSNPKGSIEFKTRKRRCKYDKSLPGLNRVEIDYKGYFCDICDGKFVRHEGMREIVKHMKTLHGFSCNFNGQKLASTFKFNKSKAEPSIKMQPGLVCPVCMMGWKSKRLLREHVTITHGAEWVNQNPSGPLAYQCRYCEFNYWRAEECYKHEREKHSNQSFFECYLCSETELRKVCINRHIKKCHADAKLLSYISYKCKLCLKVFPDFKLVNQHFRKHHPLCVTYRCPNCNSTSKNKATLFNHFKLKHCSVDQCYRCQECGRTLYSKRALLIHTQLKHERITNPRFKCRLCERYFESKDMRKEHYAKDHANENIFVCRVCGKGFASKSGLHGHEQVHLLSIDAFKCEYCLKPFSRRDSYNEHLLIHTGPRHKCPHCGKEFVQRSNMIRHIRTHTGEKPYKCSHCDKTFSDKGACNSHIRVHTREEVSACTYCGKTFSKKQKLKYHMRKHTGVDLVACEVCGKSFTHNSVLKEHRLTHDLQTQALCTECGRAFSNSKYLARHIQSVHEPNNQIYACPMCAKTFSKQQGLKTHMMTHASYKRLQCQICTKSYTTLNSLRKHVTAVHEFTKDQPEYKRVFECLSKERTEFLEFQKNINISGGFTPTFIRLPTDGTSND